MDRFDRIYAVHKILSNARYPVSGKKLQEQLECSRATFARIVEEMRDFLGAPLVYDRQANGWRYDEEGEQAYQLPGLWFNAQELSALLLIQQLISELQPGFLDTHLHAFKQRVEELLSLQQLGSGDVKQRVKLLGVGVRQGSDAFAKVAEALLQRRQLEMVYHARGSDENTKRTISPQRLVHYRDNWYVDAWCHLRNQLRTFSVDRIKQLKIFDDTAKELDEELLDKHFSSAYGIFSGEASNTATLRFTAEAARWVSEEKWHPQQQGTFLDDGRYELQLPYANPRELMMDILKYGSDVEVVAPLELRERIKNSLQATLKQY